MTRSEGSQFRGSLGWRRVLTTALRGVPVFSGYEAMWFGIRGLVASLPVGFRSSTLLTLGTGGVNRGMQVWGTNMLRKTGKDPNIYQDDFSLHYLGYTTDNGTSRKHLGENCYACASSKLLMGNVIFCIRGILLLQD
jgi:hypothetical protein